MYVHTPSIIPVSIAALLRNFLVSDWTEVVVPAVVDEGSGGASQSLFQAAQSLSWLHPKRLSLSDWLVEVVGFPDHVSVVTQLLKPPAHTHTRSSRHMLKTHKYIHETYRLSRAWIFGSRFKAIFSYCNVSIALWQSSSSKMLPKVQDLLSLLFYCSNMTLQEHNKLYYSA